MVRPMAASRAPLPQTSPQEAAGDRGPMVALQWPNPPVAEAEAERRPGDEADREAELARAQRVERPEFTGEAHPPPGNKVAPARRAAGAEEAEEAPPTARQA